MKCKSRYICGCGIFVLLFGLTSLIRYPVSAEGACLLTVCEMRELTGGTLRCCKTDGSSGDTDEDCQACHKRAANRSKKYNNGPVCKVCKSSADVYDSCDMSGEITCGLQSSGHKWEYWNSNEDCLGVADSSVPSDYKIDTASGDKC